MKTDQIIEQFENYIKQRQEDGDKAASLFDWDLIAHNWINRKR